APRQARPRASLRRWPRPRRSRRRSAPGRRGTVIPSRAPMTDALLAAVAADHGTPTYVYDLDVVTDRFRRVERAFPGARVHYAVKANALGPLLAHLAALGARAEALTLGELERALRAGFAPRDVVLGGPGHTPELAARAGAVGVG